MRIMIGADQYPEYINGAAMFTARLAHGLAGRGHTVDLLWPSVDRHRHDSVEAGLRIHRLSSVRLPSKPELYASAPWTAGREVAEIMTATRPDVVHVQSHFALGNSLIRTAKAAGVPVLATNHFMPENVLPHVPLLRHAPTLTAGAAWRHLARVYRDVDALSAPTQRAVELLASATDLPPALAISCGIDLDRFRAAPAFPHVPTLLYVGRLEQEKHVDELLRAMSRIPADDGVRLEIVGMGSLRTDLEALSVRLGVRERVTFLGAVSDDALVQAYQRADVFVMPGTAELQSLATLEAMASGLPVVAADAMALPHLVADAENGYLYRPGDVRGLTQVLTHLLGSAPLRRRLGEHSRRKASQHSFEATLTAFEHCYDKLIRSRRASLPETTARALLLAS